MDMGQNQSTALRRASLYSLIGGEQGVRRLVETFYDVIEGCPQGHAVHLLHLRGHGVAHSRIEQFNFLCGFLGGPRLYGEKYGHSDVRLMHGHVEIDAQAKDAWLTCMFMAIDRVGLEGDLKQQLMASFTKVATRLVNRNAEDVDVAGKGNKLE